MELWVRVHYIRIHPSVFQQPPPLVKPLYLAGCPVASHPLAPSLVEPLLFGWLSSRLPSAGAFASNWATAFCHGAASCHASHLLSSCRPILCIRLLAHPSNLASCHVASHLPALAEPLSFGWLLHCLPSTDAFASHWATASCCSITSRQPPPPPLVQLPPLITLPPLVAHL